jgi:4-amino-4-deoxy-L-arabinose transferase-like glycosyltransferase/putative flippase GtrA
VPPRFISLFKFLAVGLTGIAVNELVYVAMVDRLVIWFVLAAIVSTEVSTTWNFFGSELWAFSGRRFHRQAWVRYVSYAAMNNALLLLRVPMLWLLSEYVKLGPAWANLVALGALFVLRFAVSDSWVWRAKGASKYDAVDADGRPAPAYRYDIGGLLRLDSDSELPELAYFRTAAVTPPDIAIRTRRVAALPAVRVRLRRDGDRVTYREHLGILGADFNVTMGNPIVVEASQLLSLSRHVLYTNVVEALLRFVLVSKGYVLLHSAGLDVDGKASLLSAQTDTGKTSTIINLVRERHWRFISDDMAIIDPAGVVRTFPKPMTLSYHTMSRAVDPSTLGPRKRMQLQVQSRVHSKSGRTVGKGLGTLNVPIMSINSVLQIMVPPPKYHITALLPAHISAEAPIANVFLMERGEPIQERVPLEQAIDQLIENTDDAYGFPPFAALAPHFVIGGRDYQALRARERELLTAAMQNVTIWRLRVRGHEWGELLPKLILGDKADTEPSGGPGEPDDREPVGIPIHTSDRPRVGIPIRPDAVPARSFESAYAPAYVDNRAADVYASESYGREPFHGGSYEAGPRGGRAASERGELGSNDDDEGPPRGIPFAVGSRPVWAAAGPAFLTPTGPFSIGAQAASIDSVDSHGRSEGLAGVDAIDGEPRETAIELIRANAVAWLVMAGILATAAFVRLWAIGAVGFNNDEAVYAGQGAALAGDPVNSGLFAIFRAHPLLVQFLFSLPYRIVGVNDITPRLIAVAFGLAAVLLCYHTGKLLYGRRAGMIAAAVLAVMPYHVIVTRQALLDGPETTLFLLSIYLLARYSRDGEARWLFAAAFAAGLTVLAKETAILLVPVAAAYFLLTPSVRLSLIRVLVAVVIFVVAFGPYPAAILIGKGTGAAQAFFLWEVLRQPNHPWTFYAEVIPGAVGPLVVVAAVIGLILVIRRAHWQDRLLLAWLVVPIAFFEVWPVKGYQYLLPIAPAIAILVGLTFDRLLHWADRVATEPEATVAPSGVEVQASSVVPVAGRKPVLNRFARVGAAALMVFALGSIAVPSVLAVENPSMSSSLAGTGGLPGGREVGLWIKANVPQGASFLTIGPTMANIVEFYGQRKAYGLSVSPNPLRRNPAYDPINNPDRALQLNQIQYIATDIWSAQRSPYFAGTLNKYLARYHGALVYQQRALVNESNTTTSQVVIRVYEVRP